MKAQAKSETEHVLWNSDTYTAMHDALSVRYSQRDSDRQQRPQVGLLFIHLLTRLCCLFLSFLRPLLVHRIHLSATQPIRSHRTAKAKAQTAALTIFAFVLPFALQHTTVDPHARHPLSANDLCRGWPAAAAAASLHDGWILEGRGGLRWTAPS
ncbi:hypothetical protein IWX90DRAFT_92594 [Phyllosticta citrichinensis]|uniref:Uncharacterized protein n=1 Tax=Phyllosticta citrichinensis TaxID=1130410 RepID=A0ABR1XF85_9PEZI